MKTQKNLLTILFGALLMFNSTLYSFAEGGNKTKDKSLEQQIAAYVQYPGALKNTKASVVAISFQVDSKNRIIAVQSHSGIKDLDTYLIRSLSGKKLKLSEQTQPGQYLVRIRFRDSE